MVRFRTVLLHFAILLFVAPLTDGRLSRHGTVSVNLEAFDWAATLISQGRVVADKNGHWRNDHPNRSQENDFIRDHGFPQYSKWYLGIDERHGPNSKARYKFPFSDFQSVHRCGLLAVESRAREYGYQEIQDAAAKLLRKIDSAGPGGEKHIK
jgi:hypothetical protein